MAERERTPAGTGVRTVIKPSPGQRNGTSVRVLRARTPFQRSCDAWFKMYEARGNAPCDLERRVALLEAELERRAS